MFYFIQIFKPYFHLVRLYNIKIGTNAVAYIVSWNACSIKKEFIKHYHTKLVAFWVVLPYD